MEVRLNLMQETGQKDNLPCDKCKKDTDHVFTLGWNHDAKKYLRIYRCCICKEVKQINIASAQELWEIEKSMKHPQMVKNF